MSNNRPHETIIGDGESDAPATSPVADQPEKPTRRARAKQAALNKTPNRFRNPSDLQVRVRTGAVYIGLSVVCVLVNDITTVLYLCIVSAVCAGEFYYILRGDAKLPNESIGVVAAICYPIATWLFGLVGAMIVTVGLMLALLVWYVFWMRARIADVGVSLFGAMYTGMQLSALILIRDALPQPWGGVLLLVLLLSVWGNDSFAYLFGSKFGKHKMARRISPKKSWEGFAAGLVASALFWCLIMLIPGVTMQPWQAVVFGMVSGGMGVLGDLAESRIKRNVGVKDSGTIMPGHGGLLDRTDSLFLVSVVSAILLIAGGCIPNVF